jgi:hypothetical protein
MTQKEYDDLRPKAKQIAICQTDSYNSNLMFVLMEDGTLWRQYVPRAGFEWSSWEEVTLPNK